MKRLVINISVVCALVAVVQITLFLPERQPGMPPMLRHHLLL